MVAALSPEVALAAAGEARYHGQVLLAQDAQGMQLDGRVFLEDTWDTWDTWDSWDIWDITWDTIELSEILELLAELAGQLAALVDQGAEVDAVPALL